MLEANKKPEEVKEDLKEAEIKPENETEKEIVEEKLSETDETQNTIEIVTEVESSAKSPYSENQ